MTGPRLSIGQKLLFSFVSLLVLMLVVEVALRLAGADSHVQNRFFVLNRALDYPRVFDRDHDLFWRFRPGQTITSEFFEGKTYTINSLGMRGAAPAESKSRPRLLALGNSCTFGWGVADTATYIERTGAYLGGAYETINGGIPGYSSWQGLQFFRRDLAGLQPDVVFIMFGWNDQWAAAHEIADKNQRMPSEALLVLQNRLNRLELYRVIKRLWLESIEPDRDSLFNRAAPVYRVGLEDFRKNLGEICREVEAVGAIPVLLTQPQPNPANYQGRSQWRRPISFHRKYNEVVRQTAAWKDVTLIDLAAAFDDHPEFYDNVERDFIHFNASGHDFIGRRLARFVRDEI